MNLNRYDKADKERTSRVLEIAHSKNLGGFRRGCHMVSKEGLKLNEGVQDLESILSEGIREIELLVGDKRGTFIFLESIEEMGLLGYFDYITEGIREYEYQERLRRNEEHQINELDERISQMEKKGDIEGVRSCELEKVRIEEPERVIDALKDEYTKSSKQDREIILQEIRKYERTINVKSRYRESRDYYEGLHYNMRELLHSYFYKENLKETPLRYLQTELGSIRLDYEHILLMEELYRGSEEGLSVIRGIRIYLTLETYYKEITEIKNKQREGEHLHMVATPDNFKVRKYSQYSREYMIKAIQPEGARCYEIRPREVNRRSLQMSLQGGLLEYGRLPEKYKAASEELKGQDTSLVYKGLSREKEEKMIPLILNEGFSHRDGRLRKSIDKEIRIRYHSYSKKNAQFIPGQISNIYSRQVQPYTVDIIGSIVLRLKRYLDAYKGDMWLYYISADRLGVAIRECVGVEYDKELLQEVWSISERLGGITYKSIMDVL